MRQPIKINKTNPNKGVLDYSYLLDASSWKTWICNDKEWPFLF